MGWVWERLVRQWQPLQIVKTERIPSDNMYFADCGGNDIKF